MNPCLLTDTPPYQYNYAHRGSTIYWNGSDQLELYNKNIQDKSKFELLKRMEWVDTVIEYSYNSHGFRCPEFDQRPSAVALGCSFTEGTGLLIDQTWPAYLSNKLNLHVWNLGTGGGSIDTVFRIFDHYIRRLNTTSVFILIPPEHRFEFCDMYNGFPIIQACSLGQHESFAKEWLSQPINGLYNTRKTMLAIQHLCKKFNVSLYAHSSSDTMVYEDHVKLLDISFDLGRDLMHRGPLYQQWIADTMYQKFMTHEEYCNE